MFIEAMKPASAAETLSGLLGAMRVLSGGDRLSFAQAVAPYFAGHDAFRWLRCVMPVARRLVGHDASYSASVASIVLTGVASLAHLPSRDCDGQSACGHQQHGKFNGQSAAIARLGNASCGGLLFAAGLVLAAGLLSVAGLSSRRNGLSV